MHNGAVRPLAVESFVKPTPAAEKRESSAAGLMTLLFVCPKHLAIRKSSPHERNTLSLEIYHRDDGLERGDRVEIEPHFHPEACHHEGSLTNIPADSLILPSTFPGHVVGVLA